MTSLPIRTFLLGCLLSGAPAAAQIVFEPPLASDAGNSPYDLLLGDIDEDGFPDALVSDQAGIARPSLLVGNGDGSFKPPLALTALPKLTRGRALVDLDGDTHLDLVSTETPAVVAVRLGEGRGVFGAPVSLNPGGLTVNTAQVGDFNGDGATDVAICFTNGAAARFDVALGHGDGSFDAPVMVAGTTFELVTTAMQSGDVNGDGFDDFVVRNNGKFFIVRGQAALGAWSTSALTAGWVNENTQNFVLADLDGDGRDDAITTQKFALATPGGSFAAPQGLGLTLNVQTVGAGDLDGDGNIDVIRGGVYLYFVELLRGHGDGTFQYPEVVVGHATQGAGLGVTDADADGRLDVVVIGAHIANGHDSIATLRNHTYPAGSPFLDLGHALGGGSGPPILLADGSLVAGTPYSFRLLAGTPNGSATLVVGMTELAAPFKGGILFPLPELVTAPMPLTSAGALTLAGNWPPGASGVTFFMQFWMPQAGTPKGSASSSGLRGIIP